jgi:hypothetical protein
MRAALLGVLVGLAAATIYEALIAFGAIDLGTQPGDGAVGEGPVFAGALLLMLVGAALALVPQVPPSPPLAPSGAAFLLAHFYTFDPYYLPSLRRMSDHGLVAPWLVFCVAAVALATAVLALRRESAGRLLTVAVLVASAFLSLFAGAGH